MNDYTIYREKNIINIFMIFLFFLFSYSKIYITKLYLQNNLHR